MGQGLIDIPVTLLKVITAPVRGFLSGRGAIEETKTTARAAPRDIVDSVKNTGGLVLGEPILAKGKRLVGRA